MRVRTPIDGVLIGLGILVLATLCYFSGVMTERWRFDEQKIQTLRRYDEEAARIRALRIEWELSGAEAPRCRTQEPSPVRRGETDRGGVG